MTRPSLTVALVVLTGSLVARPAEAQLFGKFKEMAKRKGAEATARAVGRGLDAGDQGVDSTIEISQLARRLAAGRVVLPGVRFASGSDQLDPSSAADVALLAAALRATTGVFAIEAHLAPEPGAQSLSQSLSMRRAAALQSRLVAAGVDATRLLATGIATAGQTAEEQRPGGTVAVARIH